MKQQQLNPKSTSFAELLEALPEETMCADIKSTDVGGPLPPPEMFSLYEKTLTGASGRIMKLVEREQEHRHDWDNKNLKYQSNENSRGQMLGFLLGIVTIISGVYCAYIGQTLVAIMMGIIASGGIVTAFIKGKHE